MSTGTERQVMAETQSECSHTPGPWRFDYNEGDKSSEIVAKDDRICESICIVPHDDITEEGERVVLANARLIAAAPDLYATLNDVLDSFDRQTMEEMLRKDNDAHDDDEFCVNLTAKQLRAINQAILKAEGKV